LATDNGGWRSKGTPITCPKCGNDSATLLETTIYGKTSLSIFCVICSHHWNVARDVKEIAGR